ncbi:MAG TPA: DUF1285 domain-containing protein [Alphaproteobacteria bacterium]|nr:DUF1285 domain-containing protein [Alphaproteobacteria bacterium]
MASASLKSDLPQSPSGAGAGAENAGNAAPFRISTDGTWFYRGSAIRRPEMVKLFASVLRREGGGYMLVTPYEGHAVVVDDAPFVAVAMRVEGQGEANRLVFTTNIGEDVALSSEHPLVVRGTADEPRPYIVLGAGIEARIARSVYYDLAVRVEVGGDGHLGIRSSGAFFALEPLTMSRA